MSVTVAGQGAMTIGPAIDGLATWWPALLSAAIAGYCALVIAANRLAGFRSGPLPVDSHRELSVAGARLKVATWNIGYAGLGADSDFVSDGGRRYRAPSRAAVRENLDGVVRQLAKMDADVFLLQEIAARSPLNHGVDVLARLRSHFTGLDSVFDLDVRSRFLPPPLQVAHGTGIFSRLRIAAAKKNLLALENEFYGGLLRKEYRMQVARLANESKAAEWVVINVHLAAFDKDAKVRRDQLRQVLAFAVEEFDKGHHVIIGGDWNMEFVAEPFPHQTAKKHRFWLHDFDYDALPPGWQAVFDGEVASVRTLHQAYQAGVNYTAIIDGFIASPNVTVSNVRGIDLGFAHTDHHPVEAVFAIRP